MSTARGPEARTVHVKLDDPYAGWEATAKADFKAKHLAALESGKVERIIPVLDAIIIEHNFPDADTGERAASMGDVDVGGMAAAAGKIFDAIGKLPNR